MQARPQLSSIFNSDMPRLITISLPGPALAVIPYVAIIQIAHPTMTRAPTQFLNNRLFIESYIYGPNTQTVLAGSSLTRRLPQGVIGPGTANISISAGNALTDLEIVANAAGSPNRVFFEINKIDE